MNRIRMQLHEVVESEFYRLKTGGSPTPLTRRQCASTAVAPKYSRAHGHGRAEHMAERRDLRRRDGRPIRAVDIGSAL